PTPKSSTAEDAEGAEETQNSVCSPPKQCGNSWIPRIPFRINKKMSGNVSGNLVSCQNSFRHGRTTLQKIHGRFCDCATRPLESMGYMPQNRFKQSFDSAILRPALTSAGVGAHLNSRVGEHIRESQKSRSFSRYAGIRISPADSRS